MVLAVGRSTGGLWITKDAALQADGSWRSGQQMARSAAILTYSLNVWSSRKFVALAARGLSSMYPAFVGA